MYLFLGSLIRQLFLLKKRGKTVILKLNDYFLLYEQERKFEYFLHYFDNNVNLKQKILLRCDPKSRGEKILLLSF